MVKMDTEHDLSTSSMKMVSRKRKKYDDDDTEDQTNNNEQVKIYICGSVIPTGEIRQLVEWHVFDGSRNREEAVVVAGVGEDGVIDSPLYSEEQNLSSKANMYLNDFGCAVVNDDIYIIGGDNQDFKGSFGMYNYSSRRRFDEETIFPLSNKVRIFNTVSKNWRDFNHLMITGRTKPVVVYVVNKLFVFGSFFSFLGPLYPEPWAEYYDFGECGWLPLENIPKEFDKSRMAIGHAIIPHTNHLLLWSFRSFALFNANDNTWLASLQNQTLERGVFSPHVATVAANCGSILYWFYGHSLFAYDLMENKNIPSSDLGGDGAPLFTFQKPWDGPAFVASCDIVTAPHLISTRNKELCLIWFDILSQCICCTEFLLQEEKDKITWSGTHHYHRLSRGNHEGYSEITHCIPVVTPKSKMHQSSNEGDTELQRSDPEFGDRDLRVVHSKLPMKNIDDDNERFLKTFADTVCNQISKCLKEDSEKERSEKEKSEKERMLEKERGEHKKNIQNESMDEFLTKHNIKEFATVFAHMKIKDPYDMEKLIECEMREYGLPRASWVKLEAAMGRSIAVCAQMD